jgi:lysophospholipase L1-like esterase
MKHRFIFIAGLLGLFLAGCSQNNAEVPVDDGITRVACIGNSITYGDGIEDRSMTYPAQLGRLLGEGWEVQNFGVNGATLLKQGDLPYWETDAYREALAYNPDVVIIKLGTNDTKPQNWQYADAYIPDYEALIDSFAGLSARPQIWLALPAPAYAEQWGISPEVIENELIPRIRQVAARKGVPIIDLQMPLSNHPEWFPDDIHPNAEGAGLIAQAIFDVLTESVTAD